MKKIIKESLGIDSWYMCCTLTGNGNGRGIGSGGGSDMGGGHGESFANGWGGRRGRGCGEIYDGGKERGIFYSNKEASKIKSGSYFPNSIRFILGIF